MPFLPPSSSETSFGPTAMAAAATLRPVGHRAGEAHGADRRVDARAPPGLDRGRAPRSAGPPGCPPRRGTRRSASAHCGASSDGLRTTPLPASRAGKIFQDGMATGKFHGVIIPTTPTGGGSSRPSCWRSSDGTVWPSGAAALAGDEAAHVDGLLHVAARLDQHLARLAADEVGQLGLARGDAPRPRPRSARLGPASAPRPTGAARRRPRRPPRRPPTPGSPGRIGHHLGRSSRVHRVERRVTHPGAGHRYGCRWPAERRGLSDAVASVTRSPPGHAIGPAGACNPRSTHAHDCNVYSNHGRRTHRRTPQRTDTGRAPDRRRRTDASPGRRLRDGRRRRPPGRHQRRHRGPLRHEARLRGLLGAAGGGAGASWPTGCGRPPSASASASRARWSPGP